MSYYGHYLIDAGIREQTTINSIYNLQPQNVTVYDLHAIDSGAHDLWGLFGGQRCGNEFFDILA